jgi:NitT/TauT family transport system permease protein
MAGQTTVVSPGASGTDGGDIVAWRIVVALSIPLLWEAVGRFTGSIWVSTPSRVALRLYAWASDGLVFNIATTVEEIAIGLAVGSAFGMLCGLVLGRTPVLAGILRPIIVALYSVPLISLAPLFIMLFGLGQMPQIVLVAIVVFFLIFFNTFAGAEAVDQDLIRVLRLMGASRGEVFRKVVGPASIAWIIGGLKVALPYALVAATTGEMLGSRGGIGFLLNNAAQQFDMTSLYAALIILVVLGILTAGSAAKLESWLLRWRHASH